MREQFVPPHQKLQRAVQEFQQRDLRSAEASCREVLAAQPYNADALHLLGLIASEVGEVRHAVQLLQRAIALQPSSALYRNSLEKVFASQGAINESIKTFRDAVRIQPQDSDANFNLDNALCARKEFNSAESKFAQPAAANKMGIAMMAQGKVDRAIAAFRLATQLQPNNLEAFINLGRAYREKGELNAAALVFQNAVRLNPTSAALHGYLGDTLLAQSRLNEAIASYRVAVQLDASQVLARINLGVALRKSGEHEQAVAVLAEAVQLDSTSLAAHHNLGNALRALNRFDEAALAFDRALKLDPSQAPTLNSLGLNYKDQGQIEQATICFREAIRCNPDLSDPYENLIYSVYYQPDYDSGLIAEDHARWNERFADPLRHSIQPHRNDRSPKRRLKIGYVAPDFFNHCQSFFTIPLLSNHDRTNFEITCYSSVRQPDALTSRIESLSDRWRNIFGVSDDQAAEMIRQDQIDILIDLTLHMNDNRLMIFARKPAPVQVTWLGYPGTTGLRSMDYRLTDPYLDPPGTDDLYVERAIRLANTFWCYDPLTEGLEVGPLPAKTAGYVTFGCLNNFCKVNEAGLELWAQVLQAVPHSQLVILADPGSHRERVLQSLQRSGIDSARRVRFVPRVSRAKYLEYFHQVDIALDTLPYNGHTTSLDGFWMGVPLVSLVGNTVVGRAGLSQLSNLSLAELVAKDKPEFVRIATELAGDIPRLDHLRSTLRSRMQASPLMDAPRFARSIEQAYREAWTAWCEH